MRVIVVHYAVVAMLGGCPPCSALSRETGNAVYYLLLPICYRFFFVIVNAVDVIVHCIFCGRRAKSAVFASEKVR